MKCRTRSDCIEDRAVPTTHCSLAALWTESWVRDGSTWTERSFGADQLTGLGNVGGAVAFGQEAVIADAREARRVNVLEESPQELHGLELHGLLSVVVREVDTLPMRKARRICSRRGVVVMTMNDLLSVRSNQWITLATAGAGGRKRPGLGTNAQPREARRAAASFNSTLQPTPTRIT
jgi:hypothetical protein